MARRASRRRPPCTCCARIRGTSPHIKTGLARCGPALGGRAGRSIRWLDLVVGCSGLVGGHDPQLAYGCAPGPSDHERDAVGDVLGLEHLGVVVERVYALK